MDRALVRILIAMELYAFGDEMLNEENFVVFPGRSPLKQHLFVRYLFGVASNAIFFGGIAAIGLWMRSRDWIGDNGTLWIVGACAFLFLLLSAISTLYLPGAWYRVRKARKRVLQLLMAMAATYSEACSNGPISARRIHELIAKTANDGVVWPAPLFALLDDVMARSGRL
jgi:hypothetical protein